MDQRGDLGIARVRDRRGPPAQHRMPHLGDLENGHGRNMVLPPGTVKAKAAGASSLRRGAVLSTRAASRGNPAILEWEPVRPLQVTVRDNNVDQALKVLKKKMQREGIFREMKLRNHYEKPSEKRARERAEAIRRARKLARKRAQKEV